jgi:DNA-binding PadR family transcriptional regulator
MSLQFALLGVLGYQSMTGYEMKKLFDQSIGNFWPAQLSQIYRELAALEKKEWVLSVIEPQQDRPDKKIYSITSEGKNAFQAWLQDFPEWLSKETRDEFLVRIFFGAEIGRDGMLEQMKRYWAQKKHERETHIAAIGDGIREASGTAASGSNPIYWRFIEKRARMSNEALILWAEECIRELEEMEGDGHENQ